MTRLPNFANYLDNVLEIGMVLYEAQGVVQMRLMGMAGLWSVSPHENSRMITEKVEAIVKATTDAGKVSLRGGSPDQIAAAAIAPMRTATRANSKRLSERGKNWG